MSNIVDLTITYFNGLNGFSKETERTIANDGWNASTLTFYSHCGTHMDAPIHFDVKNETIDEIPVDNFVGKAWVVDVRYIGSKGLIEVNHIPQGIMEQFTEGDSLIFWTGWSQYINQPKYRDELPRISEGLAHWCLENKVKMIGVEPPSVADVNNIKEVTKVHQILLEGVVIIEGLTNLDKLSSNCVELIALPLKIGDGDGAPARVIAIEKY
ncbi:cyclase family protein [Seonamhaeicola aphaedonensis]|uniref:Kynurenine formamidase n=1 Tax=Seonamhaeicola aphaedonensis TaxID=1461338 RepID=A0A3D9HIE4_9FLAO|nr:cyclase family protein [Seonamhaeicola aphaedonensis]RED49267.1 kynurenine formamidase [Seonamhaeicola aphaedonensis]